MPQKKQKQQPYLPGLSSKTVARAHGGELSKGKRKTRRPFDAKQALHVVLRSSKARGKFSMLHPQHCNQIESLLQRVKKRWNVQVYRYANVGNHLHLLVRAKSLSDWRGFIRELSGGIATIVTSAKKGKTWSIVPSSPARPTPKSDVVNNSTRRVFWDQLVFTRIVSWGRDFNGVARYVSTNLWESFGVPVRKILARGFQIFEMSDDGAILIPKHPSHWVLEAFQRE